MPKTVSATEAKNNLGAVIEWAVQNKDDVVVVKSRGEPKVVVMSFAEYEKVKEVKEKERRREALETLRAIREKQLERNRDLTEEEADALADRFSHELVDDLAKEGKVRFERDERQRVEKHASSL